VGTFAAQIAKAFGARVTGVCSTQKADMVRSIGAERERMSEGSGRAEMERRLIEKSLEDESFRQRLLEDPKAAVEKELGSRLPKEVRVVTVEETADTIYLVLPGTPMAGGEGVELSDKELESVAGADWGDATWQMTCGNDCYPTAPGMFGC